MCGRLGQSLSGEEIAALFGAMARVEDPGGRYNIAPADTLPVVEVRDGQRVVAARRWSLIPH